MQCQTEGTTEVATIYCNKRLLNTPTLASSSTLLFQVSAHGCLQFMSQKLGVGAYMEKPSEHIREPHQTIGSSKMGLRWVLTWDNTVR